MKLLIPQGNELIEEGDGHGHSTLFFISKKNPYPNPEELPSKIANGEVKAFVFKKVKCSVLQNHNISHFAHTVPGQKGGDHLHSVHASSRGILQVGDLRQQSPQDQRQDQPSACGHLHARGLSIKVATNPSQTCFKVRLKGYGEKGSQESSFQNRRGTQEMAPVHGEERRLSRFFIFTLFPSQTLLLAIFSSVLRRKPRPGDDAGKLFNVRGRRSAGDQQRQRRDSNGSRRFSIVPESIVSDEEGRY